MADPPWTDIMNLQAGPIKAFAENYKKIAAEVMQANQAMMEFNAHLARYYEQVSETWKGAQEKVDAKKERIPVDSEHEEASKRVWIDMFDNDFTELFDSEEFGKNYGQLLRKEMQVTKHWGNITDIMLESANLPSKKEIADLTREIHSLKKRIARLEAGAD